MAYRNIVLIDDDADDQEIFLSAMEIAHDAVNCITFSSAREALQQLISKIISVDLIFLDLNMPIMTGQQFLAEFAKLDMFNDTPVIVLSTSSNAATIQQTKELGALDFITKPEKFTDLVSRLKEIVT